MSGEVKGERRGVKLMEVHLRIRKGVSAKRRRRRRTHDGDMMERRRRISTMKLRMMGLHQEKWWRVEEGKKRRGLSPHGAAADGSP